jgi:hypothetical protein
MALTPTSLQFFLHGTASTTTLSAVASTKAGSVTGSLDQKVPAGAVGNVFSGLRLTSFATIYPPVPQPSHLPRQRVQQYREIGSSDGTTPLQLVEGGLLEITVSAAYNGTNGSVPAQAANSFSGTVVVTGSEFGTLTLPMTAAVCIASTAVLTAADTDTIPLQSNPGFLRTVIAGIPYPCKYVVTPILWPAFGNEFVFTLLQEGSVSGLTMVPSAVTATVSSSTAQVGQPISSSFNIVTGDNVQPSAGTLGFSDQQWNESFGQIYGLKYSN